jgi:uncharacterized protein (TIGR04255 family)
MKLPKSISPCPIKESVSEVRFEPNVPEDAVFGIVYQALKMEFAQVKQLPILSLPVEFRTGDKDLMFQPYYRLENAHSTVLLGPRTISVGMRGEYPGWAVHSSRIKAILLHFYQAGVVGKISRFGLRYISFFGFDIFPNLLLKITVDSDSLEGEETFFKTVLSARDCKSLLQIRKGVALTTKPDTKGSVVDIDSFETNIEGDFVSRLDNFLENAHRSEKELFFRLLKPEFLKTLNPVYDNGN